MAQALMELFGFQQEDVDKLQHVRSRLIGNDPGTGKTYEGIALDLRARAALPSSKGQVVGWPKTLVVCPKAAIEVWDEHCMELTDLDVTVLEHGNGQASKLRDKFAKAVLDPHRGGYFIVNYESAKLIPELRKVKWLHLIADEVHMAKNRKAQLTIALKKIPAMYKTGMSGTPADDKPQDLWSVINWLWPKYYTAFWKFVKVYCERITHDPQTGQQLDYIKIAGPNEDTLPALHKEMSSWYVRRRKEDVLPDLPDKYYTRLWVELGPKQRQAYDQMKKVMVAWVSEHQDELDAGDPIIANAVVVQLIRLQQFALGYLVPDLDENGDQKFKVRWKTNKETGDKERVEVLQWLMVDPSSKVDTLIEILKSWPNDKQVIIFSQSRLAMNMLGRRLEAEAVKPTNVAAGYDFSYGLYTGETKQNDRNALVKSFQAGQTRLFCGTIKAGGVSLTLTAANTVLFLDRMWNPAKNLQAEDRAHRIGQVNAVQIIDMMARNTVDLGRASRIAKKWEWIQLLLGDEVDTDLLIKNVGSIAELNSSLDMSSIVLPEEFQGIMDIEEDDDDTT